MKKSVKEYLWDNLLMEASLIMLWFTILYVVIHNEFFILVDLKVFLVTTIIGTIVWVVGLIHEVKK